jgi:hypothetical protein
MPYVIVVIVVLLSVIVLSGVAPFLMLNSTTKFERKKALNEKSYASFTSP